MEATDRTVRSYNGVLEVLTDPDYTVPGVPGDVPTGGVAWLRAHVARFSSGAAHRERRAAAMTELARLDPQALRDAARDLAAAELEATPPGADPLGVAWSVPVALLAAGLGARDPEGTVPAVRADAAVAALVGAFGDAADEPTATRIGLLVQACDATAGLIRQAAATGKLADGMLTEVLRHDPPVTATRRVAPGGGTVLLDIAAANRDPAVFADPDRFDPTRDGAGAHLTFGAGPHACPGAVAAVAIAIGVLEAVRALVSR
jgi:cytochrome P450